MARPKGIDWLALEAEYRSGVGSIEALAAKAGCSSASVREAAKKRGWVRDPGGLKRERVSARLASASGGVSPETDALLAQEVDRDVRVMAMGAQFYEDVITRMTKDFPATNSPTDQKKLVETNTIAVTMYRKLRGLEDKPTGKTIEDLLRDL